MAHQLIFTSMRRTLIGGSGYGIAAQTPNFPKVLAEELARHSGYSEVYPPSDPNRAFNPVNYLHHKSGNWHILGRICHTENDYSGRSNFLAHYFVLEPGELAPCGPVALLQALPFLDKFEGDSRIMPAIQLPKLAASKPKPCAAWRKATGDAGWGGALAESLSTGQPVGLLYGKNLHGPKALELVGEALALMAPADQWKISLCTHMEGYPKASSSRLKMLQDGCPSARDFRQRPETWDLTKDALGQPPGQDWPEYAKTGIHSLSKNSHANIAELDPADLDSAIESYQAPASFASPAPAMIPPPVVRVLPDEPKADSRLKKQVKPREDQSKSSVAPYLLAGGLSFLALGIGFLAGYLPQKETIAELNNAIEKLGHETEELKKTSTIQEAQLKEGKKNLSDKDKLLGKQMEESESQKDRAKKSNASYEQLKKDKELLEAELILTEQNLIELNETLNIVRAKNNPLSALKDRLIVDKNLEETIANFPEKTKESFQTRLNENQKIRDNEIDIEKILKDAEKKYQLSSEAVFSNNSNLDTPSLVSPPTSRLPIIGKILDKEGSGKPAPAELIALFDGAVTNDREKSIFWVAQGSGKVPFALNKTAINIVLDKEKFIKNLYEVTVNHPSVLQRDKDLLKKNWPEYLETINSLLKLRLKVARENEKKTKDPLPKGDKSPNSEKLPNNPKPEKKP